jgi:hypothetical protein
MINAYVDVVLIDCARLDVEVVDSMVPDVPMKRGLDIVVLRIPWRSMQRSAAARMRSRASSVLVGAVGRLGDRRAMKYYYIRQSSGDIDTAPLTQLRCLTRRCWNMHTDY